MQTIKKKFSVVVVLSVLICIGLSIIFLDNINSYTFKKDASYYINGTEYKIGKGSKVKIDSDENVTLMLGNKEQIKANSLPAFFNDDQIVIMNKMIYYYPSFDNKFEKYKLSSFVNVEYNFDTDFVTFSKNNTSKENQNGFLYDGHNTYVFLENMTIYFNDKKINVSPLSYAIVEYNNWVQIFDYKTKVYTFENIIGHATGKSKGYTIDLTYSTINYNGNESLMPCNTDLLRDYLGEK